MLPWRVLHDIAFQEEIREMGWPQMIMIVTIGAGIYDDLVKYNQGSLHKENFTLNMVSNFLLVTILYCGGFWG